MATTGHPPTLESELSAIGVALEGPSADYPLVTRRVRALVSTAEPFETLRDLLRTESRLRVDPPGRWTAEKQQARERSWSGYGSVVRLRKQGRLGPWTVLEDGEVLVSEVDRRVAFEIAGDRMQRIAFAE
ncbi:hypothetical protein [Halopiger xanaduensis]|uniref:Uncharacterized protein n=1 Tax=Halopiger xanaduensis (strain DSM 18323 / JCM 14033 / SH-6) TaxID=797210 RepID=F8DEU7_HALXS|nr:hypothetical protein [Halopiger xanaduensis]AEH39537.1 hypothetical protein Halxa_0298 [Halopiger xanaduensis SH-6]